MAGTRRQLAAGLTAVLVGLVVVAGACGSSGRDLAEVPEGVTAPPRSTSSTVPPTVTPAVLTLTTDAWAPGGTIPATYGCDGEGTSPPLSWGGVPPGTSELALVVTDPDADGFVHWIVTGIAPTDGQVEAGAVPEGATQRTTTAGEAAWFPLCPPPGELHTYNVTLLAFDLPAEVPPGGGAADVVAALEAQATDRSVITGSFER